MHARLAAKKLVQSLGSLGPRATVNKALLLLRPSSADDQFDRRNATDTAGEVSAWSLGAKSPNAYYAVRYQTMPESEIRDAIKLAGCRPDATTFVDLGCGKGRPLFVAATVGFHRVIGVEFAESLVAIARANVARFGTQVEVVLADVADFRLPPGDLLVFLYNPFSAPVMQRVAEKMRNHSGRLKVLYAHPKCANILHVEAKLKISGQTATGCLFLERA